LDVLALEFTEPRRVTWVPAEAPEPDEGGARVLSLYSGISAGTELLAYRGQIDPEVHLDESIDALGGNFSFPFRYGYSSVGVVERSRCSLEEGALVFALHPHQSAFTLPAPDLVPLGEIDARLATLFPLVETGLQISLDVGAEPGATVLVFGLGAVGVLTALLLARAGAAVIGVEPQGWRRDVAIALGIRAVAPGEQLADEVVASTSGAGTELAVEVSGQPSALVECLGLLAHEGRVVVASWYGTKEVPLPLGAEFHRRRLHIESSQVSSIPARLRPEWDFDRRGSEVVGLLGTLPLDRIATHAYPYRDAARAYEALDAAEPGLMHAALRYDPAL
jgi:threonine dehydrogenase-like Zn-dependent dehydrogenase